MRITARHFLSPSTGTFALLLAAIVSTAVGLSAAVQGLDLPLALSVAFTAMASGWLLSFAHWRDWGSLSAGFLLGIIYLILAPGQLLKPLIAAGFSAAEVTTSMVIRDPWQPLGLRSFSFNLSALGSASLTVAGRMVSWLTALIHGRPAQDALAIALVWGWLVWLVCFWAAWAAARGRCALTSLTPALIVLAGTLGVTHTESLPLLIFVSALLAASVWDGQVRRERVWERQGIDYSTEIRTDLTVTAVPLLFLLIAAALLAPSISIHDITQSFQRLTQDTSGKGRIVAHSLGLELKPSMGDAFTPLRAPGLPREHLIGSGAELTRQPAMSIRTNDASLARDRPAPHYYWREVAYDIYTGRGWSSSGFEIRAYAAGQEIGPQTITSYRSLDLDIVLAPGTPAFVYSPGPIKSVSEAINVAWRNPDDFFAASLTARSYHLTAFSPQVSAQALRQAGTDYPAWVSSRYLQLPEALPARVRTLARDLTAIYPTAYDQAKALEDYLRKYPYTLNLPAPPGGRDVVDYFLFDLKKGYCDYYATAMVVLARSVGIPARLASGYASGTYDSRDGQYMVTQADAHSWAEIYFPTYGWMPFEPTAGRPASDYQASESTAAMEAIADQPYGGLSNVSPSADLVHRLTGRLLPAGLTLLALAAFTAFLWLAVEEMRLRRSPAGETLASVYRGLRRLGRRFQIPMQPSMTPFEFADRFAAVLEQRPAFWLRHGDAITYLVRLYAQTVYSPHHPGRSETWRAWRIWRRLRLPLFWLWLRSTI